MARRLSNTYEKNIMYSRSVALSFFLYIIYLFLLQAAKSPGAVPTVLSLDLFPDVSLII